MAAWMAATGMHINMYKYLTSCLSVSELASPYPVSAKMYISVTCQRPLYDTPKSSLLSPTTIQDPVCVRYVIRASPSIPPSNGRHAINITNIPFVCKPA